MCKSQNICENVISDLGFFVVVENMSATNHDFWLCGRGGEQLLDFYDMVWPIFCKA